MISPHTSVSFSQNVSSFAVVMMWVLALAIGFMIGFIGLVTQRLNLMTSFKLRLWYDEDEHDTAREELQPHVDILMAWDKNTDNRNTDNVINEQEMYHDLEDSS